MKAFEKIRLLTGAVLLTAVLCAQAAFAVTAEVEDISGRYFETVHGEMQAATQSVHVAIYEIRVYQGSTKSRSYALLQDLVDAHKRGVDVNVFLDRGYRYSGEGESGALHDRNDLAGAILEEAGVPVQFMGPEHRLHAKLVVIDGRIVIDGSVNWSQWALTRNIESATLIRSEEYAAEKLGWFTGQREMLNATADKRRLTPMVMEEGPTLGVAQSFLLDEKLAPRMVTKQDERCFDVYLWLVRQTEPRDGHKKAQNSQIDDRGWKIEDSQEQGTRNEKPFPTRAVPLRPGLEDEDEDEGRFERTPTQSLSWVALTVEYDQMADALGMTNMTRVAYRRQITKVLRKLQNTYGLIECSSVSIRGSWSLPAPRRAPGSSRGGPALRAVAMGDRGGGWVVPWSRGPISSANARISSS